jgi:3'-phosphoadenosine 5'-phosphosulfate sulfotransferase
MRCNLIILSSVATLLDAVAQDLELRASVRNQRLDEIRCSIEDFREDLEKSMSYRVEVKQVIHKVIHVEASDTESAQEQASQEFDTHSGGDYQLDVVACELN